MRLRNNPNLNIHQDCTWRDLPVIAHRGELIHEYLKSIHDTLNNAICEYSRTCVIRFDLHLPQVSFVVDSAVISRFMASLKSQIKYDQLRKAKAGRRVHPCHMRNVWAKERESATNCHYHVAILLNGDAYFSLGRFRTVPAHTMGSLYSFDAAIVCTNMAERINQAWASALGLHPYQTRGLVHFPQKPVHSIDVNSWEYYQQFSEVFYRLSYLAKASTKRYGDSSDCFGCSRR